MTTTKNPPEESYGVLLQDSPSSIYEETAEEVRRIGYAVLDSGLTKEELRHVSEVFDQTRALYVQQWGEERLRKANELYTIRAPFAYCDSVFINLATNRRLVSILEMLIVGKFILNQQNGIINPPGTKYNQGSWHRDLPYQHYTSSSPLAVNALFCVDDFTADNGSTYVLPATHRSIKCPSKSYINKHALQIEAKAGQYILLDCMLFHSGGFNRTDKERRAVNHVFTIPYLKQQIRISTLLDGANLSPFQRELLGFDFEEPATVEEYLQRRGK